MSALYNHRRHDRRPPGRTVEWRVSKATYWRFWELVNLWEQFDEGSDDGRAVEDDIRALPGFPKEYDPERDIIQPTITTV